MTRKKESPADTAGGVKKASSKRPRKKKQDLSALDAVIDQMLGGSAAREDGERVYNQLKKRIVERMLSAELTHHLGYERGEEKPDGQLNHRNGSTPKTVKTDTGKLPLDIPRDREGSFEPQLIPKGLRRLDGFDDKVLALYARGVSVREIRGFLEEQYQMPVSPDLISQITDEVLDEVSQWQQRSSFAQHA